MRFKIENRIFDMFPGLNIGIVIAKGIDNAGESDEVMRLIHEKENEIRAKFNSETLSQDARISAWRQAYSSFGAKPKKYRCSVENLYRMVLDGIALRHINKVVDIYNLVSISHAIPVGGDDIDKVDGDIVLKPADGTEEFVQLNSEEKKHPKEGEVVYVDDKEVLCRRWNWRECDKSKMTEETTNVLLVVEGLPPVSRADVEAIVSELGGLVHRFCGGELKTAVLDKDVQETDV